MPFSNRKHTCIKTPVRKKVALKLTFGQVYYAKWSQKQNTKVFGMEMNSPRQTELTKEGQKMDKNEEKIYQ